MTLIADLFALQEIDSAIDLHTAQLEAVRDGYGDSEEAETVRSGLAVHTASLADLEPQRRELELEAASILAKAEPVETKLYDGSITNPKELDNLQRDLEQLTRQRQSVEERLLAVMEDVDTARGGERSAETRLTSIESDWAATQAGLHGDETRLESELTALQARRAERATRIPAAQLVTYDRLRQRRKGVAVVKIIRGTCLGCRLTLPPVVLQRARSGANPTPCPSCERLIYAI